MKTFVLCLFFLLFPFVSSFSQIKPSSLSLSGGQGAISSGLRFNANFTRNKDLLTVSIGQKDIYFVYQKNIYKKIYSGPSLEYYHNIPTLGLLSSIGIYEKNEFRIGMTNWFAFSLGNPDQKVNFRDTKLLFFYLSSELSYKNLTLSGGALWFEEWGYLFDLKYTKSLTEKLAIFSSAGYNFYKDGNYIFSMGINYTF